MSMQYPLVVGGAGGIGRAIALVLASRPEVRRVDIVDRAPLVPIADETAGAEKLAVHRFDLESGDFSFFDRFVQGDTDGLFITAGFGRLALFEELDEAYIERSFTVNSVAPIRIVRRFYGRLLAATPFPCAVMVSIAGFMSSPFFSIYGATKAALKIFIESVNVELERAGSSNRLLNVSPGSIAGTGFSGGATDLKLTTPLAREIIAHAEAGDDLFIPRYEEVFREVLERYHTDFRAEGRHSYDYKLASGRIERNRR